MSELLDELSHVCDKTGLLVADDIGACLDSILFGDEPSSREGLVVEWNSYPIASEHYALCASR